MNLSLISSKPRARRLLIEACQCKTQTQQVAAAAATTTAATTTTAAAAATTTAAAAGSGDDRQKTLLSSNLLMANCQLNLLKMIDLIGSRWKTDPPFRKLLRQLIFIVRRRSFQIKNPPTRDHLECLESERGKKV